MNQTRLPHKTIRATKSVSPTVTASFVATTAVAAVVAGVPPSRKQNNITYLFAQKARGDFLKGTSFPTSNSPHATENRFSPINYVSPTPPWSFSFAGGECPARSLPVGQAQPRTSMTKMTFRSWLLFWKTNSMNPRPLNIAKR